MSYRKLVWVVGVLATCPLLATAGDNELFRQAVQQNFIQATFAGSWESGCVVDGGSGRGMSVRYEFSADATAVISRRQFADAACSSLMSTADVSGAASLDGLMIDSYGRYIYKVSITPKSGDVYHMSLNFSPEGVLTAIDNAVAMQQTVMHKVQ